MNMQSKKRVMHKGVQVRPGNNCAKVIAMSSTNMSPKQDLSASSFPKVPTPSQPVLPHATTSKKHSLCLKLNTHKKGAQKQSCTLNSTLPRSPLKSVQPSIQTEKNNKLSTGTHQLQSMETMVSTKATSAKSNQRYYV